MLGEVRMMERLQVAFSSCITRSKCPLNVEVRPKLARRPVQVELENGFIYCHPSMTDRDLTSWTALPLQFAGAMKLRERIFLAERTINGARSAT